MHINGADKKSKYFESFFLPKKILFQRCSYFYGKRHNVLATCCLELKYLGTFKSSDGRNRTEIASKIALANKRSTLKNNHMSIHTRRRALECYVERTLMYGCEAWKISKQVHKKPEGTEMWFLRRMLRIL